MGVLNEAGIVGLTKTFDVEKLRDDFINMRETVPEAQSAWEAYSQIGLTARPGCLISKRFHDACGSLMSYAEGKMVAQTSDYTELAQDSFGYINEVIGELREVAAGYGRRIGRVRFMGQAPKTCLSLHRDLDEFRFHIPLFTNGNAFFVVDDKVCRMPTEGRVYLLNTRAYHTVVNADRYMMRVHLLADTYK